MRKCQIFILTYVGYVKDGSAAVASFKKVHAACSASYLKKRKKGTKAEIPPPTSKAAKELLSIGNRLQFNVSGSIEHVRNLSALVNTFWPPSFSRT